MTELRSLWRWLDGVGVDWISVWDHLYEAPGEGGTQPHFEAVATLAALAADTTRARLGCLVFCAPYRNVGLLAKSVVTVDHVSDGRFELGIGSGWYDAEALAYGLRFPGPRERFDILAEQVDVLRAWFRGERVTAHGSHLDVEDAFRCCPVRRGGCRSGSAGWGNNGRFDWRGPRPTGGTPPMSARRVRGAERRTR